MDESKYFKHTYIFANSFDYMKSCYMDTSNSSDITYLNCIINNSILNKVRLFYSKHGFSKNKWLPFRKVVYGSLVKSLNIDIKDPSLFIFYQVNRFSNDIKFVSYLRNKYPQSKFVYFFTNNLKSEQTKEINILKSKFDRIYTMDENDALYYSIIYHENVYSKIDVSNSGQFTSDILFVGYDKGRAKELLNYYEYLTDLGLKCDFSILDVDENARKYKDDINYDQKLSYKDILKKINGTRCILEILQKGQIGSSLRLQEALIYGKKLITTNDNIRTKIYYDSNQIQIIQKPLDIDVDFISRSFNSNNDWQSYFSPLTFISELKSTLVKK